VGANVIPVTEDTHEEEEAEVKPKKKRRSLLKRYVAWLGTLNRLPRVIMILLTIGTVVFLLLYVSAVFVYAPWYTNEFQEDIPQESQWIEVSGEPFQYEGYSAEGETWTQVFSFPANDDAGIYVSEFTIFLIWFDDKATDPDTFTYRVLDPEGTQVIAGGNDAGQVQGRAPLGNNEVNHEENYQGWTVEVTCVTAADGYRGPGGIFSIPDDGNDFTARFEWKYFIEHNPDWD
jgi:hypothetical protein